MMHALEQMIILAKETALMYVQEYRMFQFSALVYRITRRFHLLISTLSMQRIDLVIVCSLFC